MLGYIAGVWIVAIIGGYLPFVVDVLGGSKAGTGDSPWISVFNVLSGGFFVAAGFMHLLPQAEEGLRRLSDDLNFELAPFVTSLGFVLIFLLEELVEGVSSSRKVCSTANSPCSHGPALRGKPPPLPPLSGGGGSGAGSVTGSIAVKSAPGVGYGIGSLDGRSVDENYHLYGSSPDSGYPSPVLDRGQEPEILHQLKGTAAAGGEPGVVYPGAAEDHAPGVGNGHEAWTAIGDNGMHVTSLKGDGGSRSGGVKRLGSRGSKGTYGAIDQSPARAAGTRFWDGGAWSRTGTASNDPERGHLSPAALGSAPGLEPVSPTKDGHGPWIGRRVAATGEVDASSLSATVARALDEDGHAHRDDLNRDDLLQRVHHHSEVGDPYSANVRLLLGAVLSFHAVMEGLGLGASSASGAPGIFAAIVLHKGLAAFGLGCIFYSSDAPKLQCVVVVGIFSSLTPLGAAAGMVIRAQFGGSIGASICTGLGAGTFLHVAAMEVLPRDLLHDSRLKSVKIAALVIGYLVCAGLSYYV